MQRILGLIFIVIAVHMALTIYTEGLDQAYGGVFAGLASDPPQETPAGRDNRGVRLATQRNDNHSDPAQTSYNKLVDRVRTKTHEAMRKSERRAAGLPD